MTQTGDTKRYWQCPDPRCRYLGNPAVHLLDFEPWKHDWSKAQVVDSLTSKRSHYPYMSSETP